MNKTTRLTVLGLVFVLSTLFFWQAINTYLIPSKAQLAPNMKIFISEKAIQCNDKPDSLCLVHIFGSTEPTTGLAGVTGAMSFSENLNLVGITQEGFCSQASFGLDYVMKYTPVPQGLKLTLGTIKGDNLLATGTKCITTVGFKRTVPANGGNSDARVMLADASQWQAVGSQQIVPDIDTAPVVITFSPSAPIPSITITPPVVGGPGAPITPVPGGNCSTKAKGDCTCDGKIDVRDWEVLRSSIRSEGNACDVNGDGTINSVDLTIWKTNHD
ncbi:MAG: hypothetical protein UZ22_OP11002000387 [Microgenomates bacterium OLB23]|nr:MAG: hypothetical protein UZ22_OP11002000387 [Microgenomates bacterium OLB23]